MNQGFVKILLVDDDEDDYFLTREYLSDLDSWNFEIVWSSTYSQALELLQNGDFDICLFDYFLGEKTGINLLEEAISIELEQPIILLTGKGDTKIAVDALRMGAADYLIKSEINADKLERSIRYVLERNVVIKALKHSERRYKRIFEESKDFLFISDLEGQILDVNMAAVSLSGYSVEQLNQMKILEIVDGIADVWSALRYESIQDREVVLLTSNGDKRYCVFTASLESDQNSVYVHGRIHDITVRRQTERDRLHTEKLAATSRLVSMLAHEVRNPLTNVNLSAEQLEIELVDEDHKYYTSIIKRSCTRINNLISQLLEPSNFTDVQLDYYPVQNILEDALLTAHDRISLKKITIEKYYAADLVKIPLDRNSLQIAFLNLITNAIEAMAESTGILKLTTRILSDQSIQIIIADNGSGIGEENLGKIFEHYYTSKSEGMGVGLTTTLNIIHTHHGTINVDSELGVGTTFTINFARKDLK
jgi:PAS domain S-box-containing protein